MRIGRRIASLFPFFFLSFSVLCQSIPVCPLYCWSAGGALSWWSLAGASLCCGCCADPESRSRERLRDERRGERERERRDERCSPSPPELLDGAAPESEPPRLPERCEAMPPPRCGHELLR